MPIGWNGGDPTSVADPENYELGTAWRAEADITITHARVYTDPGETTISPRRYRIWSSVGALQYTETLPDDLPSGWFLYELTTPQPITTGTVFVTSYNTGGNYSALANALDSDVVSSDGNVTALAAINAPGGHNGRFNETPGAFPNLGAGSHPFYGIDFQYTVGIGGNTAPRITGTNIQITDATVTVTLDVEDDETLVGASYRFGWDDGSPDTVTSSSTAQHTYTGSGHYALLLQVTDASGLSDYDAALARVTVPSGQPLRPSFIYPDAEQLVLNYLRPRLAARPEPWLTGLKLGNKKPETSTAIPPERIVYVRRIGGLPRSHLDLARIDFKCYGKTEYEAQRIAALVFALMQASVNHGGITTVDQFLGLTNAPDDLSNAPRYMFTMELQIEGDPL